MTRKNNQEALKRDIRDLSDQISDMQDDLNVLDMYDTGAFGMLLLLFQKMLFIALTHQSNYFFRRNV